MLSITSSSRSSSETEQKTWMVRAGPFTVNIHPVFSSPAPLTSSCPSDSHCFPNSVAQSLIAFVNCLYAELASHADSLR